MKRRDHAENMATLRGENNRKWQLHCKQGGISKIDIELSSFSDLAYRRGWMTKYLVNLPCNTNVDCTKNETFTWEYIKHDKTTEQHRNMIIKNKEGVPMDNKKDTLTAFQNHYKELLQKKGSRNTRKKRTRRTNWSSYQSPKTCQ